MRSAWGTVRARATLGATTVVALALAATGVAVLALLRANLLDQAGLQAELAARDVAARIATGTAPADSAADGEGPVRVLDAAGRVRAVSDGLEAVTGTAPHRVTPVRPSSAPPDHGPDERDDADDDDDHDSDHDSDHDDTDDEDETETPAAGEVGDRVRVQDGTAVVNGTSAAYRFAAVAATSPRGETFTVYAGAPLAAEQEAVATVRGAMLAGLPPLVLVVASATWLTTRRALRPVEAIRGEMAEITRSEDLSRRVPEPRARDEIGRLARTTNETLAALQTSVERQRRFVADASHELRSPLASLRAQLEVGAAHPELLDVAGAVQDAMRLQRLAADLLLLARLDAGETPGSGRVDLAGLVREEVSQRATDRVPVRVSAPEPAEVVGSRGQLARVLGNLLDNAQRHAVDRVEVTVRAGADGAELEVVDDGPGVPVSERERVFARFVRLDEARSGDDGGAGLGLAIARDVAVRHGGTLRVTDAPGGGARFVLRLPPAPGATPSRPGGRDGPNDGRWSPAE